MILPYVTDYEARTGDTYTLYQPKEPAIFAECDGGCGFDIMVGDDYMTNRDFNLCSDCAREQNSKFDKGIGKVLYNIEIHLDSILERFGFRWKVAGVI